MNKQAIVTCPFPGVPDGEFHPRTIAAGETISGDLAEVALREGWARPLADPEKVATTETDTPPATDSTGSESEVAQDGAAAETETETDTPPGEKAEDAAPENKANARAPRNKAR